MRADLALVERGLCESRAKARQAIEAGTAFVNGRKIVKPSEKISSKDLLSARAPYEWVSRGGLKLAHALNIFSYDPQGQICVDIGSSTGGFTHVLKSRGARKIYAVDVGTDQLHKSLRGDPVIISLEQQDARNLTPELIPEAFDLLVCDASFISVMKVLKQPMAMARAGAHLISLVKPQFEVGRQRLGSGGIVRDEKAARDALALVQHWMDEQGWLVLGHCDSPVKGGRGNREFLLHARKIR